MRQVMVVTGGARGIGAATALMGARQGYAVCVNYRENRAAADAVVGAIRAGGGSAIAVQGDVSREAEVAALFDAVDEALGTVTALVNNAGSTGRASRLDAADTATLRAVIELNVLGVMFCTREAILRMSTRRGGHGGGIVNVSSGAATLGSSNEFVWYAASKAAVDTFTMGVAREVAQEGIRVNAVSPGLIETELHAAAGVPDRVEKMAPGIPMGRSAPPEEVAEPILWLLSKGASYVTGAILRVAGGR